MYISYDRYISYRYTGVRALRCRGGGHQHSTLPPPRSRLRNMTYLIRHRYNHQHSTSSFKFSPTCVRHPMDSPPCQNHVPFADMIDRHLQFFFADFSCSRRSFSKNPSSDLLLILLLSALLSSNNVPCSHKSKSRPFDTFVNPTNCVSTWLCRTQGIEIRSRRTSGLAQGSRYPR